MFAPHPTTRHPGLITASRCARDEPSDTRFLMQLVSVFVATLILFWFSVEARSQEAGSGWHWQVERVSGRVIVETASGDTFAAKQGMIVRKGWKVQTGSGRIVINRNEERFTVAPGSVVTLQPKGFLVRKMVLLQDTGQVNVDVKRRWYRHFTVETPFLAAVVKGTRFEVEVTGRTASVKVERGTVGVHDFASGNRADVGAGQSARTNPSRQVGLSVAGKTKPEVTQGPKRAPAFATRQVRNVPASAAQAKAANAKSGKNSAEGKGNSGNSSSSAGNNGKSGASGSGNSGNSGNAGNSGTSGNSGGNGNGKGKNT